MRTFALERKAAAMVPWRMWAAALERQLKGPASVSLDIFVIYIAAVQSAVRTRVLQLFARLGFIRPEVAAEMR